MESFDVVVIGGGPAGLSAAINAASEGLTVAVLCADAKVGGQSKHSAAIENYFGFPTVTGQQLANRAEKQALKFGADIRTNCEVVDITVDGQDKIVSCRDGRVFQAKAVVIATGQTLKQEPVAKEQARYYAGKSVLVVGGGNSAGQAVLHWARYANVTIAARRPLEDTMSEYLIARIRRTGLPVHIGTDLDVDAFDLVLWFIGSRPKTDFARRVCDCDGEGFLRESTVPGVFVAGDCRLGSVKRVAAAVGEGAACVPKIHQYLASRR